MKNNGKMADKIDVHTISRTKILTESEETVACFSVVTMHENKYLKEDMLFFFIK